MTTVVEFKANTTKFIINVKNNSGLHISDSDKHIKIQELKTIYNFLLEKLCGNKSEIDDETLISQLNQDVQFLRATPTQLFTNNELKNIIHTMKTDRFLHKACLYKNANGNFNIEVEIKQSNSGDGNGNESVVYLDIDEILKQNNLQIETNTYCVRIGNKTTCTKNNKLVEQPQKLQQHLQSHSSQFHSLQPPAVESNCDFCDKWTFERNMFREVLNDILTTDDPTHKLQLINASVHLLPSAILDQNTYHQFFTAIEKYKMKNIA